MLGDLLTLRRYDQLKARHTFEHALCMAVPGTSIPDWISTFERRFMRICKSTCPHFASAHHTRYTTTPPEWALSYDALLLTCFTCSDDPEAISRKVCNILHAMQSQEQFPRDSWELLRGYANLNAMYYKDIGFMDRVDLGE